MKRTYQINENCDLEVLLKDITQDEMSRLDVLIKEFTQSHNEAQTMGDEVRNCITQGKITGNVIERLSKWCYTSGAYTRGIDPARELSQYLLVVGLPRLVDEQNVRLPEYKTQILSMLQKYITSL